MPNFRTQRTADLLAGEYTTARLTLAEASSAKYVKGTVLVVDDTTGKLVVFSSDTAAKANYDLYILLENEVTADKDKTVSVVSSGKINEGKIVLNKSGDKLCIYKSHHSACGNPEKKCACAETDLLCS